MSPVLSWLPEPARAPLRRGRRWGRQVTSALRPLPDFIIIGAQKGGTTSLYDSVVQHPDVRAAVGKGLHFFDEHYARGTAWYRSNFPLLPERVGARARPLPLTGEASPDYMSHPLVPARVAALVPQVKLIALLRDPVARAQSHYHHERSRGREPLGFAEALEREEERLRGELERVGLDETRSHALRRFSYASRGIYVDQLARWLQHFPRSQLLVLRSENLYADPEATAHQVFAFLGLPPASGIAYRTLNAGSYAPADDEIHQRLRRFFAPHDARLRDLLGAEFSWDESRR